MMLPARRLFGVLLVCAAMRQTSDVGATTVQIQPSDQDTTVRKNIPGSTNGRGGRIRVHSSLPARKDVWRGLVQFDLSGIPQFSLVNSATLELYESRVDVLRTYGVHLVFDPWLEATATWNNQPTFAAAPTATVTVGDVRTFKAFSVTGDVQTWLNNPVSNHGWSVRDQTENDIESNINFIATDTRKASENLKKPRLTVDFTAPTCSSNADCQDTNPCTTNERCESGHCAVSPVICDDGDPCTDDLCVPGTGCVFTFGCDDGFACTVDTCTPTGCVNTPVDANCTNGGCTTGTCDGENGDEQNPNFDPDTGCTYNFVATDGTPCNDGDQCTQTDTCSATDRACEGSNPVTCSPSDQCHVAGTCAPGTGLCSDPPADAGTPCDDGDVCTVNDACDGSGTCLSGSADGSFSQCGNNIVQPTCGEECDGGIDCSPTCKRLCGPARTDCKLPGPGNGRLLVRNKTPDSKDLLVWKWLKGDATSLSELGDPTASTEYRLCVYDNSGVDPLLVMNIPPGGTCGTKPCWKSLGGKGFKKKNVTPFLPDGDFGVTLRTAVAGKGNVQVKGRDAALSLPALPLSAPVTVQLRNGEGSNGTCWTSKFSTPSKSDGIQFKAKSD